MEPAARWPPAEADAREADRRDLVVSEYLRQINWWFLVCFVLSSVWVSNGGTCVRFFSFPLWVFVYIFAAVGETRP